MGDSDKVAAVRQFVDAFNRRDLESAVGSRETQQRDIGPTSKEKRGHSWYRARTHAPARYNRTAQDVDIQRR